MLKEKNKLKKKTVTNVLIKHIKEKKLQRKKRIQKDSIKFRY